MYTYLFHKRRPEYRLVIETGKPLPAGLHDDDWAFKEARPAERVHRDILRDVGGRGFGSYLLNVRVEDLPSRRED